MKQKIKIRGPGRPKLPKERETFVVAVRLDKETIAALDEECERLRLAGISSSRSDAIRIATRAAFRRQKSPTGNAAWLKGFEQTAADFPPPPGGPVARLLAIVQELREENAELRAAIEDEEE